MAALPSLSTTGSSVPKQSFTFLAMVVGLLWAITSSPASVLRQPDSSSVEFSNSAPMIELRAALSPYHAASNLEADGTRWQIMPATNQLPRSVTRILVAEEPPDAALRLFPHRARPSIRQVASSDPDVVVEPAQAYGRHAFQVTIPAARSVSLALRLSDADDHPMVAAWGTGALAAHNRQLAVFFAAVAGLIAAALAITTGLAVMTGHAAPRWGAFTLLAIFLSRLASSGVFDSVGATIIGGPYGLSAMLAGLSLAAGSCLTDTIAPLGYIWTSGAQWLRRIQSVLVTVSLLAFIGVPGAMLTTEIAVVIGTAAIVAYLVHCGRLGNQAARVAAPSAAVFALVEGAAAVVALGGFYDSPAAPGVIGGFASAGVVLLALAIAAGEGIAILPARRSTPAPDPSPPSVAATAGPTGGRQGDAASRAIAASHQGVFDFNIENGHVRLSPEAAILLGQRPQDAQLSSEDWIARIHPDDREVYRSAIDDYRAHPGLAFRVEFRLASAAGRYPWFELRATMMGEGTRATRCLGLIADVTTRKESEPKAAPHDALRGLPSRGDWIAELERLGPKLRETAVALLDIDRFKSIHASLGDDGGDAVLAEFAQRISRAFSPVQIYRVGGDSFAFLFDAKVGAIEGFGATLLEALEHPVRLNNREIYVSASAGIALGREARDLEEIVVHAGRALGEAKRQGGGCTRVYAQDSVQTEEVDAVVLETELRQALKNNELEVVFQPIMRLADSSVAGFEALLRWTHPVKGLVGPSGFIGHSEQTGSIVELGKFALQQAATELALWQRYFPLAPALTVSVNLSRRQLQDTEFEKLLIDVLGKAGLVPGTLKLELTESAVSEIDDAGLRLSRLKAAGAGLAIDDFGTGLSALSQLRGLPFDSLKIDQSFVAQREDAGAGAEGGSSILRSIVGLARELELAVVAEGVETARDAQWLKDIGCEYAQGYYFSPALPRGDVLAFIARHHGGVGATQETAPALGVTSVRGKSGDVDPQLA
jgi:diguanylate cyclase (GGDEF)-like protein